MFFNRKKRKYQLELVSLHIPKTAGTSFRNILKSAYGNDAVVRLDINNRGVTRLDEQIYELAELPNARVLHGHFVYGDLVKRFALEGDFRKISWLRHPVKRVISNYFYLESRLKKILNEEQRNLNILSKMQRSLLEYAADEINQNRQFKFLQGIELEEFDFLGIQEDFNEDLVQIATVLGWEDMPNALHHNITPTKKTGVSDEVFKEIASMNSMDMDLYVRALEMRKKKVADYV